MDHFVKLEKLPDGYQFPPDLLERVRFDADDKTLCYHGYMSKGDFDRMCERTRDWSFRRKLEELFQACEYESAGPTKPASGLFSLFRRKPVPG